MYEENKMKKELNRHLKSIFRGEISANFMLEIMYLMQSIYHDLSNYLPIDLDMTSLIEGRTQFIPYLLCQHIIGVHKSKTIFMDDFDRAKLEEDKDYRSELMEDVYKEIVLRHNIEPLIRNNQLTKGDRFLLFPVPYYLAIIVSKLLVLSSKSKTLSFIYSDIANKSLAVLSLLQDNFMDCSYSTCRLIIEDFLRANVFANCKEAIKEYSDFTEYELLDSIGHRMPDEFLKRFESRICKRNKNKIDFLHYGWVDIIPHYHEIVKEHPYTFGGLKYFITQKFSNTENEYLFNTLSYFHKMCNGYTHGSITTSRYPLLHYFEISAILVNTTVNAYAAICDELEIDTNIDGIDVIGEIKKHYAILIDAQEKKSTENFEKYHKNWMKAGDC